MTEKPINMRSWEIKALLEGRKTQKRQVINDVIEMPEPNCHPSNKQKHPKPYLDSYCGERKTKDNPRGMSDRWCWWQVDDRMCLPTFSVKAKPGDRLWVRETYSAHYTGMDGMPPHYRADLPDDKRAALSANHAFGLMKWKSPIFMPRRKSRITIIVTDVRVQRLQEISEEDALAEGIERIRYPELGEWGWPQRKYADLWNSINGPGAWEKNPWVAAYSFRCVNKNIDEVQGDD